MTTRRTTWAVLVLLCLAGHPARAQLIQHIGSNNPTSEGWSGGGPGSAWYNDRGTAAAWNITQSGGSFPYYSYALTSADLTNSSGWTATMVARLVSYSGPAWGTGSLRVVDPGERMWSLNLETDGIYYYSNQGIIQLKPPRDTETTYHTYQLVYNKSTDSVGVYIDGSKIGDSLTGSDVLNGYTNYGPGIYFGGGTSDSSSSANFSKVSFEIGQDIQSAVPEPSAFLMALAVVGVGAAWVRVRRRAWPTAGATGQ